MKSIKIEATFVTVICLALGVAGCAASSKETPPAPAVVAAAPVAPPSAAPPSGVVDRNVVTATAKVKALDLKTRHVTLERSDGSVVKFVAGDNVRNLAQVKVGDKVTVTYYEALAYEVRRQGEGAPGAAVAAGVGRAKPGEKPGGVVGQAVTVTATIVGIDKAAMTVTLRGPEGDTTTFKARDPKKLDQVSVGDLVDITYTEALAISVETPKKAHAKKAKKPATK